MSGVRDGQLREALGVQVVVDEHAGRGALQEQRLQPVQPARLVEVQGEHQVRPRKRLLGPGRVALEHDNLFGARHPRQEVGEAVGHYHRGPLAQPAQVVPQGKRRAERVAVRPHVAGYHDVLLHGNRLAGAAHEVLGNNLRYHRSFPLSFKRPPGHMPGKAMAKVTNFRGNGKRARLRRCHNPVPAAYPHRSEGATTRRKIP